MFSTWRLIVYLYYAGVRLGASCRLRHCRQLASGLVDRKFRIALAFLPLGKTRVPQPRLVSPALSNAAAASSVALRGGCSLMKAKPFSKVQLEVWRVKPRDTSVARHNLGERERNVDNARPTADAPS